MTSPPILIDGMPMIASRTIGGHVVYAPDYSVPGVAERVAAENAAAAWGDREHVSSSDTLFRMWLANRSSTA